MHRNYKRRKMDQVSVNSSEKTKTGLARKKVEELLDFLVSVQTPDDLARELERGVEFHWEGLRRKVRCGTDALHVNNPDLFSLIEKEKERIGNILASGETKNKRRAGRGDKISTKATVELRGAKRSIKKKDQELNEAHLTNIMLLEKIARLERELSQRVGSSS